MKNNKRKTIIWLMTWAVLFLVIAYSPIGRPDLYVGTDYYTGNQGVSFKDGIANAPKGTAYATSEESEGDMPDNALTTDYNANSASSTSSEYSPQNSNSGAANYSRTTVSNQAPTPSAAFILAGNSSKGSAQGAATTQSTDVSSLSSDLTLTSSASTDRQAARGTNGGRDPGGNNPKNPPIPVGDGGWILLLMAGAFAVWKRLQPQV